MEDGVVDLNIGVAFRDSTQGSALLLPLVTVFRMGPEFPMSTMGGGGGAPRKHKQTRQEGKQGGRTLGSAVCESPFWRISCPSPLPPVLVPYRYHNNGVSPSITIIIITIYIKNHHKSRIVDHSSSKVDLTELINNINKLYSSRTLIMGEYLSHSGRHRFGRHRSLLSSNHLSSGKLAGRWGGFLVLLHSHQLATLLILLSLPPILSSHFGHGDLSSRSWTSDRNWRRKQKKIHPFNFILLLFF